MKPAASSTVNTPIDPDPRTWLTDERCELLLRLTSSARPLLIQAGLWRATLSYWVREQVSLEVCWDSEDEKRKLDELEADWNAKPSRNHQNLERDALRAKLRVAPAALMWSQRQWGHRLESVFLQCKNQLDRSSCRLIRLRSKPLATELYHRIKAGETTFEVAARDYGEGPERNQNGLIPLQPLGSMPFGLAPVLEHLEPGKVSQPLHLGKGFCLVELVESQKSQLDETTGEALLGEQLRLWIDSVVDLAEATLGWSKA